MATVGIKGLCRLNKQPLSGVFLQCGITLDHTGLKRPNRYYVVCIQITASQSLGKPRDASIRERRVGLSKNKDS